MAAGPRAVAQAVDALQWVWLVVALLAAWEVLARVSPSLFFPPVSAILGAFAETWFSSEPRALFLSPLAHQHLLSSLGRFAAGYVWAVAIGVPLGIVLGVWRPAGAFFGPIVRFFASVPATALLPIAIVLFGITNNMNVFLIAKGCLWPILFNTYDGVRSIDTTAVLTARSLRLTRWRYFQSILLPGASPWIFTGMRVSLGIGLILMVISELYAATDGVGYFLVLSQRTFRMLDVWSTTFLVALLGITLNVLFGLVERRLLRWHRGAQATAQYTAA